MARIWLNHWFSTAYNIIGLIRDGVPDVTVIGSNEHEMSPIQMACDEWHQEPVLKGECYVDFCLEFCRKHEIELFMPRREMLSVSRYKDRFQAEGVKVMVDDNSFVSILNQKDQAYEYFRVNRIGKVPEYRIATNVQQFVEAYESLSREFRRVCFKFVHDEGGKSYRMIDNSRRDYSSLFKKQTTRISLDAAVQILSERERFSPIMVMPYLPGEEISVDCLKTPSGLIAIPRVKDATRIERICYDDEILQTCEDFYRHMPLDHPCNIQFKYLDGIAYLLEVNTRMSGGVQMSCMASGVNIPAIAVGQMLGREMPWVNQREEKCVTHVEVPVVLS